MLCFADALYYIHIGVFLLNHCAVKAYGEAELQRHTILVSALGADERSVSSPVRFIPWGRLGGSQSHPGCFRRLKSLTPPGCPNVIPPPSSPQFSHYAH